MRYVFTVCDKEGTLKFNKGDRVRVAADYADEEYGISKGSSYAGVVGTICSGANYSDSDVQFEDGSSWFFKNDRLTREFEKGDRVSFGPGGAIYEVLEVVESGRKQFVVLDAPVGKPTLHSAATLTYRDRSVGFDPNETLAHIRSIRLLMTIYGSDSTNPKINELAFELFDKVRDLDGWLSKGGFLPSEWEHKRVQPPRVQPPF